LLRQRLSARPGERDAGVALGEASMLSKRIGIVTNNTVLHCGVHTMQFDGQAKPLVGKSFPMLWFCALHEHNIDPHR